MRRKSNRLRQRPLREDFLRRKNSACSHGRMPSERVRFEQAFFSHIVCVGMTGSVRRKSNRLRQRPLREDFLRRKNSACSHGRMPSERVRFEQAFFSHIVCVGMTGSVRRKSNRLRQRPLREDFLRRKNSACSHCAASGISRRA